MSWLPKCPSRFEKASFWDSAYSSSDTNPFEWYAEFEEILPLLVKYCRRNDSILNIGCGNSDLGANLSNAGWDNVTNIDISETVIDKMKTRYPQQNYMQMDATKMSFEDEHFNCAIDKGTIDALYPKNSEPDLALRVISETLRVLKPNGRFLIITLAQRHIVEMLNSYFVNSAPWTCVVRAQILPGKQGSTFALPVFVVMIMKMKVNPPKPIFELQNRCNLNFDAVTPCRNNESWINGIAAHQIVQFNVRSANAKFPPRSNPKEHFDIILEPDVANIQNQVGGFRLFIVDNPSPASMKFAVFVVPCGREVDELYATVDGRNKLASAVSASRLIVCCMLPYSNQNAEILTENHCMISMSDVTKLLNEVVVDLAPPGYLEGTSNAPYLTESGDDSQKNTLGKIVWLSKSNFLAVSDIALNCSVSCRISNAKKKPKKQNAESVSKIIRRLNEAGSTHLSCIASVCMNHISATSWSCHRFAVNNPLIVLLNQTGTDSSLILQVGDDCGILESRASIGNWTRFCVKEEIANTQIYQDLKVLCPAVSVSDCEKVFGVLNLEKPEKYFNVAIVLVSCSFIQSILRFSENMSRLLNANSKVLLVRCCREPTKDLVRLESEIRTKTKESNLVEVDILEVVEV